MDANMFSQIPHYLKYPEMIPYVGSGYNISDKKLLLIGESHYLPANDFIAKKGEDNPEYWYRGNSKAFNDEQIDHIHTSDVIRYMMNSQRNKAFNIFYNLIRELEKVSKFQKDHPFNLVSFYNYFQRPAYFHKPFEREKGQKILTIQEEDRSVAYQTFLTNIEILKPECVCFISMKAFDQFSWSNHNAQNPITNISIDFFPHAGQVWWNRKSNRYEIDGSGAISGRDKFTKYLKKYFNS